MGKIVKKAELAEIFGVAEITIDNYIKDGMPKHEEGGPAKSALYDTRECIDWFAVGRHVKIDYNKERARLTKLQADNEEIKLEINRGNLINKSQIKGELEKFLSEIRSWILATPSNLTPRLIGVSDENEMKGILTESLREILEDAENHKPI